MVDGGTDLDRRLGVAGDHHEDAEQRHHHVER
jgi:hypothetical protein